MPDLDTSNPGKLPSRKRVIAREVELANRDAAALTPEVISPPVPRPLDEPPAVVDPTLLGRRHRRGSHQKVYRTTQALTLLCAALATAGLVWETLADDPHIGRILAGSALFLGLVASILSGLTSLSSRWRGWAIAATVFAATVLGFTFLHDHLHEDHPTEATPKVRQSRPG